MSTLQINLNRPLRRESRLKRLILEPIDLWSRRRMILSAVAIGVMVGVLGVYAYRTSGASGLDASRSALDEAQQRTQRTKKWLDALPELRRRAALPENASVRWSMADALHAVSTIAAQGGLRLGSIMPVAAAKSGAPEGERALKLRAEGTFGEVRRFLDALGALPRLVVADAVQLKRGPDSLTFDATLRVFDTLPALARRANADARDASLIDPFGKASPASGPAGDMLLVGTLLGRERAMALIETAKGVDGFAIGQMIGDERLGRVHARSIDVSRDGGGSRSVSFGEDRP
ncbi:MULTISPECIES: type 4a pilus biogenesis protein PilO [unclassified Caballeronia]|uniref:type 4a pilus biogenesis protein PilO n=1 Tax=unclassified Caballeronia TaxID=2646786 RepID=UPI002860F827|nr:MULTISPECIES: type 4a pilus biogenesis protein PilO [unclassified Caballeronia]MDR5751836.1 type 4a pilus biogenesis protein PilO [Caballeronia sp. LZ024]MDR5844024.1 type 4a pilus biogenesis protein PilO [Caballeronia sp. LZ031]